MIVLRPPSLQQPIDEYVSIDPAFRQLAKDAKPEDIEKHELAIKVARETGKWDELLVAPDARPTKFVLDLKQARKLRRELLERSQLPLGTPGALGALVMAELLVRMSLTSIVGASESVTINREPDPRWGGWLLVSEDITLQLDDLSPRYVSELGKAIWNRLLEPSPS